MYKGIELTLRANIESPNATNNSTDTSLLQESASVDNGNPTTIEIEKCLFYILNEASNEYKKSEFYKRRMHNQQESNDDLNKPWEPFDNGGWSEFFEIFKKKQRDVGGFDAYPDNYVKYLAQKIFPTLDISRDKSQTKLSTLYDGGIEQPLKLIDEAVLWFKELNDENDTPELCFNFKGFDLKDSEDFRNCLKAQLIIAAKCEMLYDQGVKIQFQVDEKNIFTHSTHCPEEAKGVLSGFANNPETLCALLELDSSEIEGCEELFGRDEIEGKLKDIFDAQGLDEPSDLIKLLDMGNGMKL